MAESIRRDENRIEAGDAKAEAFAYPGG